MRSHSSALELLPSSTGTNSLLRETLCLASRYTGNREKGSITN